MPIHPIRQGIIANAEASLLSGEIIIWYHTKQNLSRFLHRYGSKDFCPIKINMTMTLTVLIERNEVAQKYINGEFLVTL